MHRRIPGTCIHGGPGLTMDAADEVIETVHMDLWRSAEEAARAIRSSTDIVVATHIDADGISAGAIASGALRRLGREHKVLFFKKLDEEAIESIRAEKPDLVWYTDLGSGSISKLGDILTVISDHHVPEPGHGTGSKNGQAKLFDFSSVIQVNPQLHGMSGANDLSGAGATFLVALALDKENIDLAHLAVVGSVGDLQDQKSRRLIGLNRSIISAAVSAGMLDAFEDLRLFGRETRPVYKMLEYASDPFLPGITGNEQGAIGFILEHDIEPKEGETWKSWSMLTQSERDKLISGLREHLRLKGRKMETIQRLTGEVYVLKKEAGGSPVRDAKEFATLLNACGRHGSAETGLDICLGDRGDVLARGLMLLRDHRSALSQAIEYAKSIGIVRLRNIQYFDAGDEIEETIVGTVAGMLLGDAGSDRTAPMVAFADSMDSANEIKTKASARGTQDLVARGMDLSVAIRAAAEKVGGVGGGHNIAAGATIPASRKEDFLKELDTIVEMQLTSKVRP